MKNFKFKWLLLSFVLSIVGISQMWASNTYTFYCVPKAMWGNDWDNDDRIKVYWYHKGNTSGVDEMSRTDYTYEGKTIYSISLTVPYDGVHYFQFQRFNSNNEYEGKYDIHTSDDSQWYSQSNFAGKLFKGDWSGSTPVWKTYGRDITIYAIPESMNAEQWDEDGSTLIVNIKLKSDGSEWINKNMTKTDFTYLSNPIYSCTLLIKYNDLKRIEFFDDEITEDGKIYAYDSNCNTDAVDGKIFTGWNGSAHTWVTYGRDITIYAIPESPAYALTPEFDVENHNLRANVRVGDSEWLGTWPIFEKTSYKYNGYWIYKATVFAKYNVIKQIQFFAHDGSKNLDYYDCNPASQYTSADIDGKIFGGNVGGHIWYDYGTDVALDRQGGSTGSTSVTATVGSAMPSATMASGKTGYTFGGYFTSSGGSGDQYYNANGSSAATWIMDGPQTLYAKWTANTYTVRYNSNDSYYSGSAGGATENQSFTYDVAQGLRTNGFTLSGYEFAGWASQKGTSGGTTYSAGQSVSNLASTQGAYVDLYARWNCITPSAPSSSTVTATPSCAGTAATLVTNTTGKASYEAWYWQDAADGTSTSNSASLTYYTSTAAGTYTKYLRSYNAVCGEWSDATEVSVIVYPTTTITTDPTSAVAALTTDASFTVGTGLVAAGDNLSYQWYSCNSTGGDAVQLYGKTSSTMTDSKTEPGVYYYKCVVTGRCSNATSAVVTVTVTRPLRVFTDESGDHKWSTDENWEGGVPEITDSVRINKPVIVDVTEAVAHSVTIYNDGDSHTGHLTVYPGQKLIVASTITKTTDGSNSVATTAADLLIISDGEDGAGALVWGTEDHSPGAASVDFYTLSGNWSEESKHFNQLIGTPFTSATSNWKYNYYDSWVLGVDYSIYPRLVLLGGDDLMNPFEGYCIIYNGDVGHSYAMDGTLVTNGDVNLSLNNGLSSALPISSNENLFANSWLAPIKIGPLVSACSAASDVYAGVYIFGATNSNKDSWGNYAVYTSVDEDEVVPSMQSFSLFTTSGSGSVTLDYKDMVYDPAVAGTNPSPNFAPRHNTAEEANKLRVFVKAESGYGDQVYMWERSDFSEGYDIAWDGHKIAGDAEAPQFYAVTPDGNMAVNCVPNYEGTVMGFKAGSEDSQYTFSFEYDNAEPLYLYDIDTQEYTRVLEGNTYTFLTTDKIDHNRFILTYNAQQTPTDMEMTKGNENGAIKFLEDGELFIFRGGNLYDATGMRVK